MGGMTPLAWLELLYGDAEDGWLSLFSQDATTNQTYVDWAHVDDLEGLAESAAMRAQKCNVWWGLATRKAPLGRRRGGASDCLEIPGLWLDVDIAGENHKTTATLPPDMDSALELVSSYPIPPTVVVNSGGGIHAYWLFGEMKPVASVAPMLSEWQATWEGLAGERGFHLDNVSDVPRVLRVPGTFNRKNGGATVVEILEM